jgi:arsenate reductase
MNSGFTPAPFFTTLPAPDPRGRSERMKATIWHNPACGTSRKTLAILEETPGVEVEVVEYLKTPYTADKLRQLFADAGLTAREALRLRGTDAEERGLPDADEDAIIAAMVANPAYVNRPFVETDKGVRYCRPQDMVREIL